MNERERNISEQLEVAQVFLDIYHSLSWRKQLELCQIAAYWRSVKRRLEEMLRGHDGH